MSEKTTTVETFESNANQRGIGLVNLRELVAMKQQLRELENGLKRTVVPESASSSIYPILPPLDATATTPTGAVEDINEIIKMITTIIQQIADAIGMAKLLGSKSNEIKNEEPKVAECKCATFSKVLPGTVPKPLPKVEKAPTVHAPVQKPAPIAAPPPVVEPVKPAPEPIKAPEPVKPKVVAAPVITPPTEEQIKEAHALLERVIKLGLEIETASELVVLNKDELYCIQQFRKMIKEQQKRATENFRQRFDKLCK